MKYIRTKDDIFRIDNDKISVINGCQFVSIRGGILHALDVKDEVADTIEELCDEFVCEENHYLMKPYWLKYNDDGYCDETYHQGIMNAFRHKYFNYKDYHWFGAIWTNKGLIYVAKMNDKGELELL